MCVTAADPISNCIDKCNKIEGEISCGCRNVFDNFNSLNISDQPVQNVTSSANINNAGYGNAQYDNQSYHDLLFNLLNVPFLVKLHEINCHLL